MQLHLMCTSCGEVVGILGEDPLEIPLCPRCGKPFAMIASSEAEAIAERPRIDDSIVAWLSQSSEPANRGSTGDATCQSCGYAGMIRGDAVCPVCQAVNPDQTPPDPPTVDCPNCGRVISVSGNDRGKTTICPDCKYFLGCVLPAAKKVYRKPGARS